MCCAGASIFKSFVCPKCPSCVTFAPRRERSTKQPFCGRSVLNPIQYQSENCWNCTYKSREDFPSRCVFRSSALVYVMRSYVHAARGPCPTICHARRGLWVPLSPLIHANGLEIVYTSFHDTHFNDLALLAPRLLTKNIY